MSVTPRRLTVKALTKTFKRDGISGVKSMMALKGKSGPTLRKFIDELAESGTNVDELEEYYQKRFHTEEKEYVQDYDRELYGDKDEIAAKISSIRGVEFNATKIYQIIRAQDVQPVMYFRLEGARGKGTNVYLLRDVHDAIKSFESDKSNQYLSEKPDDMVTPSDMVAMFPPECGVNNSSHCGTFIKLLGLKEQAKFREPGAKGKGAALYKKAEVQQGIEGLVAIREKLQNK